MQPVQLSGHLGRRSVIGALTWRLLFGTFTLSVAAFLFGCGGDSDTVPMAAQARLKVASTRAGLTPFIEFVQIQGNNLRYVQSVDFEIRPKLGQVSRPVHITQTLDRLLRQGYYVTGSDVIDLPIFGLYAGYANEVSLTFNFADGSHQAIPVALSTSSYVDPNGVYDHLQVLASRSRAASLGFDFFYLKSALGSPVVVDTDGEIRWLGDPKVTVSASSIFLDGGFVVGDNTSLLITRMELDGTSTHERVTEPDYTDFHHNIDPGKRGLLAEFDAVENGVSYMETILAEIHPDGQIVDSWDLGKILSDYMRSRGDDPTLFVRPGTDWFHMNASTYDWVDNSIVVSSRENFLIKLDYDTKQIKWIFGDPTKYWYTFPSLRALSVNLASGLYPIGQHGVTMTADHDLLVFNNGYQSFRQPSGEPSGESRTYSAVGAYRIDDMAKTATQVWNFDHGQTIFSNICGDAVQAADGSVLIDYASAASNTQNRLIALDSKHNVVFDFELPTTFCQTTFNTQFISFDGLVLQ